MEIDFFTFLAGTSTDYAEFLKYTADKFLSKKHKINWKCIESVDVNRLPEGYSCVAKAKDMGHCSMNHAAALNLAQEYIESDYVIFIDVDMAILYKNWDDIIVKELNKYDCFGAGFPSSLRKYRNFPSVYLFAFRSHILNKVKLDFSPKFLEGKSSISNYKLKEKEANYFGMKVGKTIHCDTGWKIPSTIIEAGFTSNIMHSVFMTDDESQLPFENDEHKEVCMQHPRHMSEWHYGGKLFVTHKHASRIHPLNTGFGKAWKKRVGLYIEKCEEEAI